MKTLTIMGIITGIILLAGILFVSANINSDSTQTNNQQRTCESCPNEGCTKTNNCGNPTCGAISGKTCGCNRL